MVFRTNSNFQKNLKKFLPHVLLGPDVNAVTDPDYADEATGAESSSHEGEDTYSSCFFANNELILETYLFSLYPHTNQNVLAWQSG